MSSFEGMGPVGDETLKLVASPDTVNLGIFAFMVDAQDNCAAAVSPDTFQSLDCQLSSGDTIATGASGQSDFMVGVRGQTVTLPQGGVIADAVVDTARDLLILSNIDRDRLEVFDLNTRLFEPSILVGAEPWGMTFSRSRSDTLYVANSAGTNVSVVNLDAPPRSRSEDLGRRIQTTNTVIWEVEETLDDVGNGSLSRVFFDFSDRPQFIAQDAQGSFVYSTKPTEAAPDGTIRVGIVGQGAGDTEVVLYTGHAEEVAAEDITSFANVDEPVIVAGGLGGGDDGLFVRDHTIGDLDNTVQTSTTTPPHACAELQIFADVAEDCIAGSWDLATVGLSDTTFVSAAGDGSLVAIGEGATAPNGRVILYRSPSFTPPPADDEQFVGPVSSAIDVVDLVGNQAERMLGVALNHDGTFGAARGLFAVYYFTPDLRLQGSSSVSPGGAGVALHPFHTNGPTGTNANVSLAFAGTGERTIEIFDTRHFTRIGRAFIRENIVGQIRAVMPKDSDQPGASFPSCTDPGQEVTIGALGNAKRLFNDPDGLDINEGLADQCVVLKLTGVTADGGVVVVDVTKADIIRHHPDN